MILYSAPFGWQIPNKSKMFSHFFSKKSLFFLFPLFLAFFGIANATLIAVPQVIPIKISLSKTSFNPQEKVEGSVVIKNFEKTYVNDIVIHYQLFKETSKGKIGSLLDTKTEKETFSLAPQQEITKSFSYKLPLNLPKGKFIFRIQLATSRGEKLGWIDQKIDIKSEGKFLFLYNFWFLIEGKQKYPP